MAKYCMKELKEMYIGEGENRGRGIGKNHRVYCWYLFVIVKRVVQYKV